MKMHDSSFEYLSDGKVRLNVYINGERISHDFPSMEMLEKYYRKAVEVKDYDVV